jgi:hypothetical protein
MSQVFIFPECKHETSVSTEIKERTKKSLEYGILNYSHPEGINLENIKIEIETQISITTPVVKEFFKYPIIDADLYCKGYLEYLFYCWNFDLGIEIAPCYIWNIILWRICQYINKEQKKYSKIFTTSNNKITVEYIPQGIDFNPQEFVSMIKDKIPSNINVWFPEFEYQPDLYKDSMYGLFAEMVQKYYGCMLLGCGCPKIRLLGTKEEWTKIITTLDNLPIKELCPYVNKAKKYVQEFIDNLDNQEYWKKFFYTIRCGSGSQKEYLGKIIELSEDNDNVDSVSNTLSKFQFEDKGCIQLNLRKEHIGENGGMKCNYHSGIMGASIDSEGIAVPKYGWNVSIPDVDAGKLTEEQIILKKKILEIFETTNKINQHHCDIFNAKYNTKINIDNFYLTYYITDKIKEEKKGISYIDSIKLMYDIVEENMNDEIKACEEYLIENIDLIFDNFDMTMPRFKDLCLNNFAKKVVEKAQEKLSGYKLSNIKDRYYVF